MVGQLLTKVMTFVAFPMRLGVKEAPFFRRVVNALRYRRVNRNLKTNFRRINFHRCSPPHTGPILWSQHTPECRYTSVVKIRSGRPDAVERWRHISIRVHDSRLLILFTKVCKPASRVLPSTLSTQRSESDRVCLDLLNRNTTIGISPILTVSSMTFRASGFKDRATNFC